MRRISILAIAAVLLSVSLASAQEKAGDKKTTGYAKVELMGALHKADDKTESWTLKFHKGGVEWSIPISIHSDVKKEAKRLTKTAKRLQGKQVIINGELFYVAPMSFQPFSLSILQPPPVTFPAITVVAAQAIREAK
jgi:hypothetical protein